jgi:hypothetical protein
MGVRPTSLTSSLPPSPSTQNLLDVVKIPPQGSRVYLSHSQDSVSPHHCSRHGIVLLPSTYHIYSRLLACLPACHTELCILVCLVSSYPARVVPDLVPLVSYIVRILLLSRASSFGPRSQSRHLPCPIFHSRLPVSLREVHCS